MTEEEKIICKSFLHDADNTRSCNEYKLLMELLEQEPTTKNDLGVDCISRAEVLDLCNSKDTNYEIRHLKEDVECLPSVYPMSSVTPQEPILDKIRAEIMQLDNDIETVDYDYNDIAQSEIVHTICREEVLRIIDKYKTEREG